MPRMYRLLSGFLVTIVLIGCGGNLNLAPPTRGTDQLATGEELAANTTEIRHDLALQLQDRTGRFINLVDGELAGILRRHDLSPSQRQWLRTLRVDAMQGILWAIQQEDVIDSEIETLFFSRYMRVLKVGQARELFSDALLVTLTDMLTRAEAIFWSPVEQSLGSWAARISDAATAAATKDPTIPSIAFVSSDLYVLADDSQRMQLSGAFGLDARLEMAARGIGYLNQTADRAIFLAEFMPRLLTMYAEVAVADLVDGLADGGLASLMELPRQLQATIGSLRDTLEDQRRALTGALRDAGDSLNESLHELDSNFGARISQVDAAISMQMDTLAGRLDALDKSAKDMTHAMQSLEENVASLARTVGQLAMTIDDVPEDLLETLANPSDTTLDAISNLEGRLQLNLAMVVVGTLLASLLGSFGISLLVRRGRG